jgi:hypothetical protein
MWFKRNCGNKVSLTVDFRHTIRPLHLLHDKDCGKARLHYTVPRGCKRKCIQRSSGQRDIPIRGSATRPSSLATVDFPEPLLPAIATRSPTLIESVKFWNAILCPERKVTTRINMPSCRGRSSAVRMPRSVTLGDVSTTFMMRFALATFAGFSNKALQP